jgi:hypothetical protein
MVETQALKTCQAAQVKLLSQQMVQHWESVTLHQLDYLISRPNQIVCRVGPVCLTLLEPTNCCASHDFQPAVKLLSYRLHRFHSFGETWARDCDHEGMPKTKLIRLSGEMKTSYFVTWITSSDDFLDSYVAIFVLLIKSGTWRRNYRPNRACPGSPWDRIWPIFECPDNYLCLCSIEVR